MANDLTFTLKDADADNLLGLLSSVKPFELHKDPGVPFAVYELRVTVADHQQEPDDELPFVQTPEGPVASPERLAYCKENGLSLHYFPPTVEWKIPRRLLVILKLVLKDGIAAQTGGSFGTLVDLCKTLRLLEWFKKTFKRTICIELADDCEMDDEIEEDPAAAAD